MIFFSPETTFLSIVKIGFPISYHILGECGMRHQTLFVSSASVQVMLFSDRLEVWNPGHLPPTLTPEKLRHPHPSIPRNPLVADPLFLAHYIEKAGSGTLDMIGLCREAKLPEPEFRQDGGQWVVTLRRPTPQVTPQDTGQIGTKSAPSRNSSQVSIR